jgi:hypothetical protein
MPLSFLILTICIGSLLFVFFPNYRFINLVNLFNESTLDSLILNIFKLFYYFIYFQCNLDSFLPSSFLDFIYTSFFFS